MRNYQDSRRYINDVEIYYPKSDTTENEIHFQDIMIKDLSRSSITRRAFSSFRPPTPYSMRDEVHVPFQGTARVSYEPAQSWRQPKVTSWSRFCPVNSGGPMYGGFGNYFNTEDRAILGAYKKLSDSKLNLAISLASANKSWAMIARRSSDMHQFARSLKRGRLKDAAHVLGMDPKKFSNVASDASSKFLEFQFGWKQLLSDVHHSVIELEKYESGPLPRLTARHVVRETRINRDTVYDNAYTWKPGFIVEKQTSGYDLSLVRLDYEIGNWDMVSANRVGLLNPAVVAWDLVPFSFVLDWFTPVGSWLNSFTADAGLRFLGGSCTNFTEANTVNIATAWNSDPSLISSTPGLQETYQLRNMDRKVYGNSPAVFLPPTTLPGSLGQAITAVALIMQRIR